MVKWENINILSVILDPIAKNVVHDYILSNKIICIILYIYIIGTECPGQWILARAVDSLRESLLRDVL